MQNRVEHIRDVVKGCRPNNDVGIDRRAPLRPASPLTPACTHRLCHLNRALDK